MIAGQCWELQLLSLTSWKRLRIILGNQLFSPIRAEETRPLMVHSPCGLGIGSQTQRAKGMIANSEAHTSWGRTTCIKRINWMEMIQNPTASLITEHTMEYTDAGFRGSTLDLCLRLSSDVSSWEKQKTKTYISAGFDLLSPSQKCWLPHIY